MRGWEAINPGPQLQNSEDPSIGSIWDDLWAGMSERIVENSAYRYQTTTDAIDLYLASTLVMGLNQMPTINHHFAHDRRGIFGNLWMQDHFPRDTWREIHTKIAVPEDDLMDLLRNNSRSVWRPFQKLVVDEMIIPFEGRWEYIQHIRGKPHNTGLKLYGLADEYQYLYDFWSYRGEQSPRLGQPGRSHKRPRYGRRSAPIIDNVSPSRFETWFLC